MERALAWQGGILMNEENGLEIQDPDGNALLVCLENLLPERT